MAVLDLPPWTPQVQDVANYLLSRTRLPNGEMAGTFTPATQPTDAQVTAIIAQCVRLHAPRMGDVPDSLADAATALLALKAAIVVEESIFTEQIDAGVSPHKDLCSAYQFARQEWEEAAQGQTPNGFRTASVSVGTLYPGYATGTY